MGLAGRACVCVGGCVYVGGGGGKKGVPNHAVNRRLYGSLSNDDEDMKLPIFTFSEGREHRTTILQYISLEFNSRKIHQHLIN